MLFIQEEAVKAKQKAPTSPENEREEDLSPVPNITQRSRRGGVSAETYSEDDVKNYVKKVLKCRRISSVSAINVLFCSAACVRLCPKTTRQRHHSKKQCLKTSYSSIWTIIKEVIYSMQCSPWSTIPVRPLSSRGTKVTTSTSSTRERSRYVLFAHPSPLTSY